MCTISLLVINHEKRKRESDNAIQMLIVCFDGMKRKEKKIEFLELLTIKKISMCCNIRNSRAHKLFPIKFYT